MKRWINGAICERCDAFVKHGGGPWVYCEVARGEAIAKERLATRVYSVSDLPKRCLFRVEHIVDGG